MQMIQVQIAAAVEADGVSGVRWVLIDPAEPAPAATTEARPAGSAPVPKAPLPSEPIRRAPLMLNVAAAVVLLAALAGAWWTASALLALRDSTAPQRATGSVGAHHEGAVRAA